MKTLKLDFGTLAYWFFPIVGFLYGTGFLIVFAFSRNFGITTTQFFEGEYINVGTLYVMGCVVILLPTFWTLHLVSARQKGTFTINDVSKISQWRVTKTGITVYGALLLTFYIVVGFTTTDFFHAHALLILGNFLVPLGFTVCNAYLLPAVTIEKKDAIGNAIQVIAAAASVILMILTIAQPPIPSIIAQLFELSPPSGAFGFVALVILALLYTWQTAARYHEYPSGAVRAKIVLSGACIIGVFIYLSILAFAYAIYPFIPCSRGGGSYIDAASVQINFKQSEIQSATSLTDLTALGGRLIVLDENGDSIFVASVNDAGGPAQWRRSGSSKPRVLEIRRDTISSIMRVPHIGTPIQ